MTATLRFVQMTDTHVGDAASAKLVESACDLIAALDPRPAFVVHTGDLVNTGTAAEFDMMPDIAARCGMPAHVVPGNHDLVDMADVTIFVSRYGARNYSFAADEYVCIVLDTNSTDAGADAWHGRVEPPALDWLDAELAAIPSERPLLLLHHHGLVGPREGLYCDVENADEVLQRFVGHRLVAAFGGHSHRHLSVYHWRGVPFHLAPNLSVIRRNEGNVPPGFLIVDLLCTTVVNTRFVPVVGQGATIAACGQNRTEWYNPPVPVARYIFSSGARGIPSQRQNGIRPGQRHSL